MTMTMMMMRAFKQTHSRPSKSKQLSAGDPSPSSVITAAPRRLVKQPRPADAFAEDLSV